MDITSNTDKQIKSKQRVAAHGEVFTAEREVNAMLDLVKQETERIDSRFLEPACGNGNFLAEIIRKKLQIVTHHYQTSQAEWELYALLAVSSIYGIDILQDNVAECRERLFEIINTKYTELYKENCKEAYKESIRFVLQCNIIWGDALSLKLPDNSHTPIVFAEWSVVDLAAQTFNRRDYTMAKLLESQPMDYPNLFSDLGEQAFLQAPTKEYPTKHYLKINEYAKYV